MVMKQLALICLVGVVLAMHARAAAAHGLEMLLGSTAKGAGALALGYEFSDPVVVTESVSIGGTTLYTSLFPGFEWLQVDDPTDALYALKVGTPFSMQIVHIDPGAAVMVGSTTLKADGQSALVATTTNVPADHYHPQWELLLPTGVTGTYTVSFRLTTTARAYTQSPVYSQTITNVAPPTASPTPSGTALPAASPTASPTPSPTATVTPRAPAGDANCDAAVSAADLPRLIGLTTTASSPACGADANDDGRLDQQDIDATVVLQFEPGLP
jgi:hypothetical protein